MRIILSDDIRRLCDEINNCGYETYIIGSSLRSAVLGQKVDKWDIITSATPDELHSIFNKSDIFNILEMTETEKYGVSIIRSEGKNIELSTMRQDGKYNRYSKDTQYTRDIREDLVHRDFTINAIAYDTQNMRVVDFKNGISDFKKGILRCVDDSNVCLSEDPVRIFRAFRFAHTYDMKMDGALMQAIDNNLMLVNDIPADRLYEEFNKFLLMKKPGDAIRDIHRHGMLSRIMPEYDKMVGFDQNNRYQIYDLEEHTLRTVDNVRPRLDVRLAALLHDIGKPIVGFTDVDGEKNYIAHAAAGAAFSANILKRMGYDERMVNKVCNLIKSHELVPCSKKQLDALSDQYGISFVKDLLEVRKADTIAASRYATVMRMSAVDKNCTSVRGKERDINVIPVSKLPINGDDVKKYMGITVPTPTQGKFIGKTLRRCAKEASLRPECNNREFMEAFAKSMVEKNQIPDFVKEDIVSEPNDYSILRTCDI